MDPVIADRWIVHPGIVHPEIPDAGIADLGIADPGLADLGIADPGIVDLGLADPEIADPGIVDPWAQAFDAELTSVTALPPWCFSFQFYSNDFRSLLLRRARFE
jgi:hypothetical protein